MAKFLFLFSVLTPLSFVHTNPDQSRNSTYISEAYKLIQKRVDKAILKKKHQLNYALVAVFDVTLTAFHSKAKTLDDLGIIPGDKLENLTMAFQNCLVEQLGGLVVHEPTIGDSNTLEHIQRSRYLLVISIIDALSALDVDSKLLSEIAENLKAFAATVVETELNVGQRLRVFMAKHGLNAIEEDTEISLIGDVSGIYSRQLIIERARGGAAGLNIKQKLEYLNDIFGTSLSWLDNLDRLLCARTVIEMIDGMCSLLHLLNSCTNTTRHWPILRREGYEGQRRIRFDGSILNSLRPIVEVWRSPPILHHCRDTAADASNQGKSGFSLLEMPSNILPAPIYLPIQC